MRSVVASDPPKFLEENITSTGEDSTSVASAPELRRFFIKHGTASSDLFLSVSLITLYHLLAQDNVAFEYQEVSSSGITRTTIDACLDKSHDGHDLVRLSHGYRVTAGCLNSAQDFDGQAQGTESALTVHCELPEERTVQITFRLNKNGCTCAVTSNKDQSPTTALLQNITLQITRRFLQDPSRKILEEDFTSFYQLVPRIVEESNQRQTDRCIQDAILEMCDTVPEELAVDSWDGTLTYKELASLSGRWATQIRKQCTSKQAKVLLCMQQSQKALIAWLAILRAGCVAVLVDTRATSETLKSIHAQTKATLLICDEGKTTYRLDLITLTPDRLDLGSVYTFVNPDCSPEDDAIIMFTSGSTGEPKGVIQTHAAISRSLSHVAQALSIGLKTRLLQFASLSFDASIFEVFGPWNAGGCVCVPLRSQIRACFDIYANSHNPISGFLPPKVNYV